MPSRGACNLAVLEDGHVESAASMLLRPHGSEAAWLVRRSAHSPIMCLFRAVEIAAFKPGGQHDPVLDSLDALLHGHSSEGLSGFLLIFWFPANAVDFKQLRHVGRKRCWFSLLVAHGMLVKVEHLNVKVTLKLLPKKKKKN